MIPPLLTQRHYPLPEDWVERARSWFRLDDPERHLKRFRDLLAYPAFRRNFPGWSGNAYGVPLADLASLDAGPEPTDDEVDRINAFRSKLRDPLSQALPLDLVVADDATEPTTTNRLLLRACRLEETPSVAVRLWWPRITDWRWHHVLMGGNAQQIERAFQTGELPEDFFPSGRMR